MSAAFLVTAFLAIGLLAVGLYAVRSEAEDRAERAHGGHRLDVVD